MKAIQKTLILILAVIAAVVAILLILDIPAWPVIVAYWITLTVKNLIDYIKIKNDDIGGRHEDHD